MFNTVQQATSQNLVNPTPVPQQPEGPLSQPQNQPSTPSSPVAHHIVQQYPPPQITPVVQPITQSHTTPVSISPPQPTSSQQRFQPNQQSVSAQQHQLLTPPQFQYVNTEAAVSRNVFPPTSQHISQMICSQHTLNRVPNN